MQHESLTIRNFGPLIDLKLADIRRFNIFIGESGSGKSTIMKVLAMMRWIYKMCCVRTYFKNAGITTPFRFRSETILSDNGLRHFMRPDSEIVYTNGSFRIIWNGARLNIPKKNVPKEELTLQKIAYVSDKRVLIPDLMAGNVTLRHNMFYLDETFLNYQKALDAIPESVMDYLGVKVIARKTNVGKRVFVSPIGSGNSFSSLPLTSASSGMQSSVALHLIMAYFSRAYNIVEATNSTILRYLAAGDSLSRFSADFNIGDFPIRHISIHLEEPELSLFPSNQWGLMKYLIRECLRSEKAPMDLTLATHSPYILTAINIMMLAFKAHQKEPVKYDALALDIPLLNPCDVMAWSVTDGHCDPLINSTLDMVDGTWLDQTSDTYEDLILSLNDIVYA